MTVTEVTVTGVDCSAIKCKNRERTNSSFLINKVVRKSGLLTPGLPRKFIEISYNKSCTIAI